MYTPIPPASSYGHRADTWDVDKWFKALAVKVFSIDDDLVVRLCDQTTDELFAECPLPNDGTPLTTAVQAVVDSSRYFVLRVVDRETGNHAFLGIGFRDRNEASGFTAALDEYRQYLRRKQEAQQMRAEYVGTGEDDASSSGPKHDYSLKPGQTLKLNLATGKKGGQDPASEAAGSIGSEPGPGHQQPAGPPPKLPPPPSGGGIRPASAGPSSLGPSR